MDRKLLIDEYLQGKHPIEGKKWDLPTDEELDRDEALYEALLRPSKSPLKGDFFPSPLRGGRVGSWRRFGWGWVSIAAAIAIVFALFTWKSFKPKDQPQLAESPVESTVQKDATGDTLKRRTRRLPTPHAGIAIAARGDDQRRTRRLEPPQATQKTPTTRITQNTQSTQEAQEPSSPEPHLANAADSLYYYLTQLEDQMGDCRDSTCFAELGNLIQADERIKGLVQKIIHKQVETAYQEEYLVDTTTRYIPL